MAPATKPPLSTADVRYLLNQWSRRGFFRIRRLGDRLSMLEVTPRSSYTLRLQTQYEERTAAPASQPYHGGPVDDKGVPPDPWDLPVRRPADFEERTERIPVPHTESVRGCPRCGGRARVPCTACHGSGRTTCTQCGGRGFRTRTETRSVPDAQGNMVMQTANVEERCVCFGGQVNCMHCAGSGTQTCPECGGAGRVKMFELLTVHFSCPCLKDVVQQSQIPSYLVGAASGALLIDQHGQTITDRPAVAPEVDKRIETLLERARPADARTTRVLTQHLHVEQVNVQEVQYHYRGQDKCLWIYGDEQRVYAPGLPRPWGKLALLVGGVVLLVLLLTRVL
jgi:hypothetical protein